jgi:hypothetical protein
LPTLPELRWNIPWLNRSSDETGSPTSTPSPPPSELGTKTGEHSWPLHEDELRLRGIDSPEEAARKVDDILQNGDCVTTRNGGRTCFDEDSGLAVRFPPGGGPETIFLPNEEGQPIPRTENEIDWEYIDNWWDTIKNGNNSRKK